jgi:hypothetical protein
MSDQAKPRIIDELQALIDTPTVERTNAQIEAVCKKAQLAIAMLYTPRTLAADAMFEALEGAESAIHDAMLAGWIAPPYYNSVMKLIGAALALARGSK